MASSGTTAFTIDLLDIIEEAYELVGTELRSGYDLKTARRSIDLLMREWGNRGINLWTVTSDTLDFDAEETSGTLGTDIIDVIEAYWRTGSGTSQTDRTMTRMSVSEYSHIANKNQTGQPSRFFINRTETPTIYVWPVPVEAGTLVYWKLRRIEDTGAYGNTMDIPTRFLPALTTGLAYYLAMKAGNTDSMTARIQMLQAEYERQFVLASEEDRERASVWLVPDLSGY